MKALGDFPRLPRSGTGLAPGRPPDSELDFTPCGRGNGVRRLRLSHPLFDRTLEDGSIHSDKARAHFCSASRARFQCAAFLTVLLIRFGQSDPQ